MPEISSTEQLTEETRSWSNWARENPLQAFLFNLVVMAVLSGGISGLAAKFVADNKAEAKESSQKINVENLATKQDKDELWRFINGRIQVRDEQMKNAATKDEVRALTAMVEMLNKKIDQQIELQQQQNQMVQQVLLQRRP